MVCLNLLSSLHHRKITSKWVLTTPRPLAIPSPMWEDLDDMLLRLSSPHTQYHFDFPFSPISLQRIRSNASFTCWRDTPGVQILYIAEASRGPALEIAHKIMMAGTGNPYSPAEPARCLDVSFSSQYNDIPSMVASMLAQDFAFGVEKRGNVVSAVIRNQLVFRKSSPNTICPSIPLRNLTKQIGRQRLES